MRRLHLIAAIVALVAAGRARAQSVADLPAGARVRITLPDSVRQAPVIPKTRIVIGTLERATTDTLWLHVAGPDTLRVPRAALRKVEVSRGVSRSRSAVEQGLFLGLAIGALRAGSDEGRVRHDAIGFAGLGAVLGTVLGAVQPYERWRAVR